MKLFFTALFIFNFLDCTAQTFKIAGTVRDSETLELLEGASIIFYESGKVSGGVSNREGKFSINCPNKPDSVIFSMVGYHNMRYRFAEITTSSPFIVNLTIASAALQEVTVKPILAIDIVQQAAAKLHSFTPVKDFEIKAFYREIIHDTNSYYSVAEAIFDTQFSIRKKACTLKMEKGRSKEDVAYTTLFEDFHPGGGPEDAVSQSLTVKQPDFLMENRLKYYNYKLDSTVAYDGDLFYVVSFDQKQGVKEALEKGYMYIDESDYSLLKFEAGNSPLGMYYIKNLRGTDKIFAEILHINLAVKGWSRTAMFTKIGGSLFLSYANMNYYIDYKQPKKGLDLHLLINTDFVVTDFQRPILKEISADEAWKRKNLVANLPTDFDPAFWGDNNILDPTAEINNIIGSISRSNSDVTIEDAPSDWSFFNKTFFVYYKHNDSAILVPVQKCNWENKETGGMMYGTVKKDFNIEAKLTINKRSNPSLKPDNGFQQCGLIIRSAGKDSESSLIYAMGTGGSSIAKYFLKRTTAGNTKISVEKAEDLSGWLRIEKKAIP